MGWYSWEAYVLTITKAQFRNNGHALNYEKAEAVCF
jgi:hypothetical protein